MLDIHRTDKEMLLELYLESKNEYVLERLINICGHLVLLELDEEGYRILSDIIIMKGSYNLYLSISDVKQLKRFNNYLIDRFLTSSYNDPFISSLVYFIEHLRWFDGNMTKAIGEERIGFLLRLLELEQINENERQSVYIDELCGAVVKNKSFTIDILYKLITNFPKLGSYTIKFMYLKLDSKSDIFEISNVIGRIKFLLHNAEQEGRIQQIEKELNWGIDQFLVEDVTAEILFAIFVSVLPIARHVINYQSDIMRLFYERFTLAFREYKDDADWKIENASEKEGIFPLGDINEEITQESALGLAFALYHGNTIRDFNIMANDRFLMMAINQAEQAFSLYVNMGILPEHYLVSDEYYDTISQLDRMNNSPTPVTTGLDISEILDGLS